MTSLKSAAAAAKHPFFCLIDSHTSFKHLIQIHAQLLVNGHLTDPHFLGHFVASIAHKSPGNLEYSRQVLEQCESPTLSALNSMIRAHSKSATPQESFRFFNKIASVNDVRPDKFTFTFMVRACAQLSSRGTGLLVHGSAIKHGFEHDPHVQSGLIFMYAELGCLRSCLQVFESIPHPCLVSQTAMISACAKWGDVGFARKVFDKMPQRDHIAWNAMISGYAQCGESRKALRLFHLMQLEGVKIGQVSLVSVLSACSHLGALHQGRWVHAYIQRSNIPITVTLGTALIDMYAKCGDVDEAMEVFWTMKEKNIYTWSSAMNGLAMNGAGHKCLELFSLMKKDGFLPNEVTFISVLRACCVVGLVDEGRAQFDSMRKDYGIKPIPEHYGCMVDLYGRAGRLDEALNVINSMPMQPHTGAWGAFLNACKLYKNTEMGELAWRKMIELQGKNHGAYVLLSNIFADSQKWESADSVRKSMKAKGVRKQPGCSVVEVDGEVHEFFSWDKSHPRYADIEVMMAEITKRLRLSGHIARTDPVLFDIEEEEKEDAVSKHSEKIAIAFGLINVKEGVPVRVVKNLRICSDCHVFATAVSNVFNREIIIRDRNRFHHFKDGNCSCNGYW